MRQRPEAGYTIAEMLVTLLILGMIAAMMLSGVAAARHVRERTDASSEAEEQLAGAQSLLRLRLEHIFPVTQFDAFPPVSDFDGESTTVTFTAPPRDAQAPSALRRYKLWLSPQGDLVLSSVSTVAARPDTADENLVLLSGVQALDIAYFGASSAGDAHEAPGWKLQWAKEPHAPELVRVHVAFESGDRRVWPDLLVRPRVSVDSDCVFNPVNGLCRGRTR